LERRLASVTLAAGLALPTGFPGRDLVLFCAFCVVVVTLVLQGGTLAPLMRLLRLQDDGAIEGEIRQAHAETARAGLEALRRASEAERRKLIELRAKGVEEELDWADLHAEAQRSIV